MRADGGTLDRIMADDFFFAYPLEGDDKAQFISDVTSGDLKIEHIAREQLSVRVFGNTAVLTARDSATWLYHGRELSGQYKIMMIYTERNGRWQLCAIQACPMPGLSHGLTPLLRSEHSFYNMDNGCNSQT